MALLHVDFFSDVLGMCMQMDVILPQQTNGQIGMEGKGVPGKIPTLYLLHGMSDDHTIWQRRTSIERYVSDLGIAVVMPTTHLAWYTDMAWGNRYFAFISKELPEICRSFFANLSDRREDTFVAGLSMGGYGALKLGLSASETFGMAASLSGGLDVASICKNITEEEEKHYWQGIFGPLERVEGSTNDLFAEAKRLKESGKPLPKIYMWCGTEDFLYDHNVRMKEHLTKLSYDLTYEESPGDHQWKYWDEKIQSVLEWIVKNRNNGI
ncbi:alpha/beta hydrolase [Anaerocolumna xylanovorans]|uniref:S-formylglutathione hydrolase FrmB n=1 Tax=Anaerocolumna xylanovorans DSM 12503 TaxID=1121345 RepID=A0A1M7YCI7_9FIRM|nr:alpha/beta hydrolase family protein [Anaerocolumna xylanovorans]SHO50347.1 S-formylglutathione hydrolase FrmB [Anaerocolumna xylanovorans DSM 12503]